MEKGLPEAAAVLLVWFQSLLDLLVTTVTLPFSLLSALLD
jgi:hypothetical protein